MTAAPDNPFHAHLDACHQCRENPFSLCASGAILLQLSATTASAGERAETARLRGDVLRLAQLAAGASKADFLTAACALAAAISAATAPPVEGLWTDLVERLHTAAGPMHDPSECAPDEGFPGLCSACRTALGNRVQAVAPGVLAPPRAGQPGWATAKALLVLLRGVEAFGLLAEETTPPPRAAGGCCQ